MDTSKHFYRFGYIIPAYFPLALVLGRGLYATVGILFYLWFLLSLIGKRPPLKHLWPAALPYGLILAAFLASVIFSAMSETALGSYWSYFLYTAVFLINLMVLTGSDERISEYIKHSAYSLMAMLAYLYAKLAFNLFDPAFTPSKDIGDEIFLPLLLPFLFYLARNSDKAMIFRLSALFLVGIYITIANGRTSIMALAVCVLVYFGYIYRKRIWTFIAAVASVVIMAGYSFWQRSVVVSHKPSEDWIGFLDKFSSSRTAIWRAAIENPPDNMLFGIGLNTYKHISPPGSLGDFPVMNLHNVLLDTWYQTGLLGVTTLTLVWIWFALSAWKIARDDNSAESEIGYVLLAGMAAVFTSAFIGYDPMSKVMTVILFNYFSLVAVLSNQTTSMRE